MSLLKVNEVQNYNGSNLTLTASTVSTSAQLNTGGNISVTGSINVSDDSTTRSNLGLGSIATQDSSNVTITGGNISNATLGSSVTFPAGGTGNPVSVAIIEDKKSSGTTGGGYTAGTWSARTLNFEAYDPDNIVSLSSNEFILSAGSYYVDWWTTGFYCNSFYSRLNNTTDSSVVSYGGDGHASKNRSSITDHTNNVSLGAAFFTITGSKNFTIEFYPHLYDANNGGINGSTTVAGVDVVFTQVKIIKLK